ncbi:MAG: sigma-70 family RNA polymerase sigma factor [Armatimonadetes bacterium]|nr:sigma-70 family RNA polymerase sigma factor [Armatimonadota bacterium]
MLERSSRLKSDAQDRIDQFDERVIIERCKAGETSAFDELVRRYEKRVFNCALRITGNYNDAADVAQEAFIRAFHSIQTFRGDAKFATWIYRIVTNVYLDERKRSKAHRTTSLDEAIELEENSVTRQIEDGAPTPDEVVENKERLRALQKAINSLPDYQRIIVTLYHTQHRSYEEIAEILKLPIGTVKSRLNRARLALAEILESEPELFG